MSTETDEHRCDVPRCDGTRLGHDLAVEFPEETARIDAAFDRLRDRIAARPALDVWDDSVAPGGYVCSACGMPTESEPCAEHQQ